MQVLTRLARRRRIRHRGPLVLLQVPGCSSFGKSGPGCMAPRWTEGDVQIAIWEDGWPRFSGYGLRRKHLLSVEETALRIWILQRACNPILFAPSGRFGRRAPSQSGAGS